MKVTKVFFKKFESNSMLGFADIGFSLDGSDSVHMTWKGLKLFKGRNGYFVSMPSELDKKGAKDDNGNPKYWPIVSFAKDEDGPHKSLLASITTAVVQAYEKDKKGSTPSNKQNAKSPKGDKSIITGDDIPF